MLALLIDGLNLVRRIHAAVPRESEPAPARSLDGVLDSIRRSVARALTQTGPTHAVCAFDGASPTWRHEIHPGYKRARPPLPEDLRAGMSRIHASIREQGVRTVSVDGFEADDVLATMARKIVEGGGKCVILSTDKSFCQLIATSLRVRNHFEERELDQTYVAERFGVRPDQLPTLLALVGERSSNVPGVAGIGTKTAARLIAEHGSLDAILAAAERTPGRAGLSLQSAHADARMSLQLMQLRTDVRIGVNLNELRHLPTDGEPIADRRGR